MNFNAIEDIIGLIVSGSGAVLCFVLLIQADALIKRLYPCEREIIKKRMDRIEGNWRSALINALAMLFFFIVMLQWFFARKDTAPDMVDIQVLLLKIVVTCALLRSSFCSYRNIRALSGIRERDLPISDCGHCKYCPKRKESVANG